MKMGILDKKIKLPAVTKVYIEVDGAFIHECLKKKKINIERLNWPEAEKALYRKLSLCENQLLHIISCCNKALTEEIIPLKNRVWDRIIAHSVSKEA